MATRHKEISQAFLNSEILLFDDTSKIVFMSDIHRGDGSGVDDFYPNRILYESALKHYNQEGFLYVELGDSDELWENKSFRDITAEHGSVFACLAQLYVDGRYRAVFGNHDMVKGEKDWVEKNLTAYIDEREQCTKPLFPSIEIREGLIFQHAQAGYRIHALHGHQADRLDCEFWRLSRLLVRYLWRPLEMVGVQDPTRAANSHVKKKHIERHLIDWVKREDTMLIAGHTHRQEFPEVGEPRYFNDGCGVYAGFISALEIEEGAIALIQWNIKAHADDTLYVNREVTKGPIPLAHYFQPSK